MIVAQWAQAHSPVLLALDAPLGWPAALGAALAGHRAGERLDYAADRLFRRRTDEWIRTRLGKRPLAGHRRVHQRYLRRVGPGEAAYFGPRGSFSIIQFSTVPPPIGGDLPEPTTLALLGLGLAGLGAVRRRRWG